MADDRLRAKGKARLEALLDSKDERTALAAARALYSYAATKPPKEEQQAEGVVDPAVGVRAPERT